MYTHTHKSPAHITIIIDTQPVVIIVADRSWLVTTKKRIGRGGKNSVCSDSGCSGHGK